jgi:hypothetical protein
MSHSVASLDGQSHEVSVYVDATAEHSINSPNTEEVQWAEWNASGLSGVKIGSQAQNVLGLSGDRVNINWGFLYLAATEGANVWAGSAAKSRSSFAASGVLPATVDTRQPRVAGDDLPAVSMAVNLGHVLEPTEHVTLVDRHMCNTTSPTLPSRAN